MYSATFGSIGTVGRLQAPTTFAPTTDPCLQDGSPGPPQTAMELRPVYFSHFLDNTREANVRTAYVLEFDPTFVGNNTVHYGDPKNGCMADEESVQIQGVSGDVCTPKCSLLKKCPTDVPTGVTVAPQCALQDAATKSKYCALICSPSVVIKDQKLADSACGGTNLSCKPISGVGICTYDD